MEQIVETIRNRAHSRVAAVFGIAPEELSLSAEFGKDLKASFVSDFKHNEFDKIDHDIKDVADREIRRQLESGQLVIRTVADYCDHMVRCYDKNAREVIKLLQLEV